MNTLSYAINFWSGGEIKALFLRHEGHLGATGAVSVLWMDGMSNSTETMFPVPQTQAYSKGTTFFLLL